jgi:hypothetical protein
MGEPCRLLNSFLPRCFLFLTLAMAGCRSHDLVEAELRSHEREMRHLRGELNRLEGENQALSHELGAIRQEGGTHLPPEASQTFALKRITLGRLTGGYAEDNVPGDSALRVIVEPRDLDNHIVKAAGAIHVEALQITPEGLKTPLSTWDVDARQLGRTWQNSFFTTGHVLILPWKAWPSSDKLRIVAQLRLSDGRMFETDRDITVHLPGKGLLSQPRIPAVPEGPSFPIPAGEERLPLPRKAAALGWRRTPGLLPEDKAGQNQVMPAAAWTPAEPPDLTGAVRVLKPVAQTSDEWPPR